MLNRLIKIHWDIFIITNKWLLSNIEMFLLILFIWSTSNSFSDIKGQKLAKIKMIIKMTIKIKNHRKNIMYSISMMLLNFSLIGCELDWKCTKILINVNKSCDVSIITNIWFSFISENILLMLSSSIYATILKIKKSSLINFYFIIEEYLF
jgi:hypothetical protein